MRVLPMVSAVLALALPACVYVERDRPVPARPAAVTTVPGAAVVAPGAVPAGPPPAAVIVR